MIARMIVTHIGMRIPSIIPIIQRNWVCISRRNWLTSLSMWFSLALTSAKTPSTLATRSSRLGASFSFISPFMPNPKAKINTNGVKYGKDKGFSR